MADRLGWSQSGNLNVDPGGLEGSGKAISMQANFATSKLGAGEWTVEFNLIPGKVPATLYAAEAEVVWSVAGNSVRRVLDVKSGASISGVAEAVAVKVRDKGIYYGAPGPTADDLKYVVSIQTTKGVRAGWEAPPILTGPKALLDDGETATFPIPINSGVISFFVGAVRTAPVGAFDPTTIRVIQLDEVGAGTYFNTIVSNWIPIARQSVDVSIVNNSGFAIATAIIWGIDG